MDEMGFPNLSSEREFCLHCMREIPFGSRMVLGLIRATPWSVPLHAKRQNEFYQQDYAEEETLNLR